MASSSSQMTSSSSQMISSTTSTQMTQLTETEKSPVIPDNLAPTTLFIAGVKVEFPTKPYPSQIAMMHQVIQGLKNNKNCLLESPTGSGKTLALLCSTLAWQRHQCDIANAHNAAIDARQEAAIAEMQMKRKQQQQEVAAAANGASEKKGDQNQSTLTAKTDDAKEEDAKEKDAKEEDAKEEDEVSSGYFDKALPIDESGCDSTTDNSDDDFQPNVKRVKLDGKALASAQTLKISEMPTQVIASNGNKNKTEPEPYFVAPEKRMTVPKIFFGTRTHKQIAQITRELRKTFYKPVRSVVLASREYACINPMLDGVPNKNEQCKELLDSVSLLGDGCSYHPGARKLGNFNNLDNYGVLPGFDLEDLVKAGRAAKACPYYATRFLMTTADIIFCPYNYLIDPNIRSSMKLDLAGQIVIFDEAHNMEDASREAASFTLKQHEIGKAMQDCEKLQSSGGPHALSELASMLSTLCTWIDAQTKNLKDLTYNTSVKHWTGTEIIAALQLSGLSERYVKHCEDHFVELLDQRDKETELMKERGIKRQKDKPSLPSTAIVILENVFRLFHDMYKDNGKHRDDFRIALIKSQEKRRRDVTSGPFMSITTLTLNVWCLNPAVAFAEIRDLVHSIVLTSGTLSPMQSFQSELGTPFPLRLEANHIIASNQMWAGIIGRGPRGVSLNGSYQNAESLAYQDEVGGVIQHMCDTMPHGVLTFFTSYRVMERLVERWKMTGRYTRLESAKVVVVEPRSGAVEFETVMTDYYNAIKDPQGTQTGGLFLAVCRGKVSEGLDFSDNNARAVICVGIPFPNFKDMQVELKRGYNQQNMSRGLLSGGDWYEIQAFRALNQALGRCIRHRQDWGAILLVDERWLITPRYNQSLSKWVRSRVLSYTNFNQIVRPLENFRDEMLARPPPEEPSFATEIDGNN